MNRTTVLLIIMTVVLTSIYNMNHLGVEPERVVRAPYPPPLLESPPAFKIPKPTNGTIAGLDVWNLKPYLPQGQLPTLKEMFKTFYTLNKNGRFESIIRSDKPNEKWELKGIVIRGDTPRALFYNESIKKMRTLGKGDLLDDKLRLSRIDSRSVTLETVGEKKPHFFEMKIISANRELYAVKKKNP